MQNTRIITLQKSVKVFAQMLFWLPVTVFSLLIIYNTLPYFSFSKDFDFIEERSILFKGSFYNACFYIHIAAGALCIGTALIQFSRYVLKRSKAIHRVSGKIYVSSEPASFAIYNFGFFEMTTRSIMGLFMFMAGWWFVTTLYGLSTIHKRNIIAHKVCMIRSYAMAMTAVTFRVYHMLFYLLGWDHLENYELSLWISVIGNMFFAEWVIWRQSKQYIKSFAT